MKNGNKLPGGRHVYKNGSINNINVNNIAIIIGPEGGFSEEEVNTLSEYKNVYTVTLGPRILRTETAGLATLAMLMYEFEL